MRILQIVNTLQTADGGPARNAYELHRALNELNDTQGVVVVIHRDHGPVVSASPANGHRRALRGARSAAGLSLIKLGRLIHQSDVVLLHGYYLWWIPVVALISKALRKRVLLTPHGSLTAYQQNFSRGKKFVFDIACTSILKAAITGIGVGSEAEAKDIEGKLPWARVSVCGVGTPIPNTLAARKATENGRIKLLSLSRIAKKKRIDIAIDTLQELRRRGEDAELIVTGEGTGDLVDELHDQVVRANLSAYVHFVGSVTGASKRDLLAQCDILLAPSDDENFGINVAEALAHGLPCVASRHVASADGLDLPAGAVVADRRPGTIADAVESVLSVSPADRAHAAHSFAVNHYSWQGVAERWRMLASGIDE